ncbi:60S ribosomal protein L21 [Gregarina niphandrodes]|uniref:60S ribosomal protein L21 n=1 Tax=Gregarina niphandrodes TaxID=110365 RepID=A0A023BE41_GRENI|nr:60S ribosomal protein L21 [Gregarina niphandrodes]EZG89685.1 60S ribosomal protein L21 [Gregarina niphandrodes]|eukprot:XP_011128459.1 60S ribosomal protein L21 [Gregarina niphandrodes]
MTHSYGYRSGTRYKFARPFRGHGMPNLTTYLTTFRRGEYVLIKGNGAIQKGMPHSYYHGRIGRVYDVTKNALGVEVIKTVGNKQVVKRIHVRREHVQKSRCQEEFNKRRAENDRIHRERAAQGVKEPICLKRQPEGPSGPKTIGAVEIIDFSPLPFTESF